MTDTLTTDDQPREPAGRPPVGGPPRWLYVAAVVSAAVAVVSGLLAFGDDGGGGGDPDVVVGGDTPSVIDLDEVDPGASLGRPAPDVGFTMFDGTPATFADFRGTPLVVNFFASWCAPCVAEMPEFEAVHQALGDEVQFLGINLTEPVEDGRAIAAETGVTYPLASDREGAVYAAFEALAMPTTVLISADGEVVDLRNGKLSGAELEDRIRTKLLGA